ncbi:MAG: hypothetical protein H0Z33_11510 [Bacillaceae bacterium]|nr:hypothetical protein [Bacillaceae bacterium]
MDNDFIRVKSLEGELKLSQVKRRLGCTVTTKEIVLQKPHHSYHIKFEDILGIIPVELDAKQMVFHHQDERVIATFGSHYYRISANKIMIYNQSGKFERGQTDLIVPLSKKFMEYVSAYSKLTRIT